MSSAAQRGHKDTPCDTVRQRQPRFQRRLWSANRSTRKLSSSERPSRHVARSTRSSVKAPARCSRRPLKWKSTTSWPNTPTDAARHGKRLVVRNGYLPSRELLTEPVSLQVKQPRVRDNAPTSEERVCFSPSVLPPYLRRSKSVDELIPWLYLKGISTGDFSEALSALLGKRRAQSQPERHRSTQGEMVAGIRSVEST